MNKKIVVNKGDTAEIEMTVVDAKSQAENLTGAAITWFLAERQDSTSRLIEKTIGSGITVTDAPAGKLAIRLTSADTDGLTPKEYFTAVRIAFADGRVKTAAREYITIVPVPGAS